MAQAATRACQAEASAETHPARATVASLRCRGLLESDPDALTEPCAHRRSLNGFRRFWRLQMKSTALYRSLALAALTAIAFAAGAQSGSSGSSAGGSSLSQPYAERSANPASDRKAGATTTPSAPSSSSTSAQSSSDKASSASSAPKHVAKHRAKHAKHARVASATTTQTGDDSGYRAQLRQCVQGPSDQRESCLDQAISRNSRS